MCEWVQEDFGIDLIAAEAVHHGDDSAADVWRATSANGKSYAIKLSGGGSAAGLIVCAELVANRVAGVPRHTPTTDGRLWSDRDGRRLSLADWVSDERAYDGDTTSQHWTAYGTLLSRLHATPVTSDLARVLPRETHTHERIAALTRDVDRRLRTVTDDPLIQALAHAWRDGDVLGVLDRADRLGAELRQRTGMPEVICHADPHFGNLLIGPAGQVWLIDWDDVLLAPPERDLMIPLGGVFGDLSDSELRLFFDAYGPVEIDPMRLAYYRSVRSLEDVTYFAAQVLDNDTQQERERALGIVQSVVSATGLIAKSRLT